MINEVIQNVINNGYNIKIERLTNKSLSIILQKGKNAVGTVLSYGFTEEQLKRELIKLKNLTIEDFYEA